MEENKDIYKMKLHETIIFESLALVRRVPGGWIYMDTWTDSTNMASVFVPFDNEFITK